MSDVEQPETQSDEGVPQTLVGISFPDIYRAQEFLTAATGLAAKGRLKLKDAVLVVKDDDGHTHVKETIDPQPGRTALSGAPGPACSASPSAARWAGPPASPSAAWRGGHGQGRRPRHLRRVGGWFREAVQPDTATVALLIEDLDREALVEEAARFTGAELVYANLDEHTLDRIKDALAGHTSTAEAENTPSERPVRSL